jgi:hypothetical protein
MKRYESYLGEEKPRLALIECDFCNATIRPNPNIAKSGWMKGGYGGHQFEFCPDCWENSPQALFIKENADETLRKKKAFIEEMQKNKSNRVESGPNSRCGGTNNDSQAS